MRHKWLMISVIGCLMFWGLVFFSVKSASANSETVIIQTLLGEAASEKGLGMQAVGEVIRQRAAIKVQKEHGREMHTVGEWNAIHIAAAEAVCLAPNQFAFWSNKIKAMWWLRNNVSGADWQRASKAWADSEYSDITKGSTHYHTTSSHPYWHGSLKKTCVIGHHCFHEEK